MKTLLSRVTGLSWFFLRTLPVLLLMCVGASAQSSTPAQPTLSPATITTGNTFQQILSGSPPYRAVTIQNNNTNNDNCWVYPGAQGAATEATSILLGQGGSYSRYFPFVPSGPWQATCASNSDTLYVETE